MDDGLKKQKIQKNVNSSPFFCPKHLVQKLILRALCTGGMTVHPQT